MIYLDASAIVKLVVEEAESGALRAWLRRRRAPRLTSDLSRVEVPRACMGAEPTAVLQAQRALSRLSTVPLTPTVLSTAAALQPAGLRTLDSLHVASALAVGPAVRAFVTYDQRLEDAVRQHGLVVERPC